MDNCDRQSPTQRRRFESRFEWHRRYTRYAARRSHGLEYRLAARRRDGATLCRLEGTSTAQPVRALKGFQRIALAPGETKKVTFHLATDAFAVWDDHNQFTVEPSKVTVWISPDSASGSEAKFEIIR